jgi:hypothetical protein
MRIACGRHADNHSDNRRLSKQKKDNRPRCNAPVLVWRILFPSDIVAGMLQKLFVSTTVHTKAKNAHRLRPTR